MTRPSPMGRPSAEPVGASFKKLLGAQSVSNLGDGVGLVAYPWLASALTRNPLLISAVLVAQRLPWLLVSLPVGVIVDRRDRRLLMVGADVIRAALTLAVGIVVFANRNYLPTPDAVDSLSTAVAIPGRLYLFAGLLLATFLLGVGEVVHDTSATTLLPQVVPQSRLAVANGRLMSAEQTANLFLGPPVGALLLAGAFVLPFLVDASTFVVSAALLMTIPGTYNIRSKTTPDAAVDQDNSLDQPSLRFELMEGIHGLNANRHVRLFAAATTVINLTGAMIFAIMIFFAQEILGAGPIRFSALTIGSAIGSVLGGLSVAKLAQRTGTALTLRSVILIASLSMLAMGFTSSWIVGSALLAVYGFCLVVWMALTTSFRQSVIPHDVLGRVNATYRFFSYGAIPIGAVLGGVVVALVEASQTRDVAVRAPFVLGGLVQLLLAALVAPRLDNHELDKPTESLNKEVHNIQPD